MKFATIAAALLVLLAAPLAAQQPQLKTDDEKAAYSIGVDIGRKLHGQDLGLDPDLVAAGIRDALTGSELRMSDEDMQAALQSFRQQMQARAQATRQKEGFENLKQGQAFLAENKDKPGVETTDSGLQYKVIEEGKGVSPQEGDTVVAHYEGKLIDGTVFDSSYERGQPAEFPLQRVIPGWTEALQMMKPGGKWMVYIPSELAYGERGAGKAIGPNETLIFQIELLDVKPKGDSTQQ